MIAAVSLFHSGSLPLYSFVTVYQTNPVFFNIILFIQHKSRPAFLPNGFAIPFISQPTAHPGYPPATAEIRFIKMPRHGNVQLDFTGTAFLPLEIDLSHGDFPLLQPVVQTHKIAFAVCQTGHAAAVHENHARAKEADTGRNACATRETSTETPAAPTIGRKPYKETSVISAAPNETIMCTRTGAFHACLPLHTDQQTADSRNDQPHQTDHLNIFRHTQAPCRIKTIAQTTDTASPGRSVCRCRPRASIPYSKLETWNSIRSPLST